MLTRKPCRPCPIEVSPVWPPNPETSRDIQWFWWCLGGPESRKKVPVFLAESLGISETCLHALISLGCGYTGIYRYTVPNGHVGKNGDKPVELGVPMSTLFSDNSYVANHSSKGLAEAVAFLVAWGSSTFLRPLLGLRSSETLMLHRESQKKTLNHVGVSKDRGTPKSSILMGISLINHPAIGVPPF